MRRLFTAALFALLLAVAACSQNSVQPENPTPASHSENHTSANTQSPTTHGTTPKPSGNAGADGSTGNNLSPEYCAQNQDPGCPLGSYVAPNAIPNPNGDGSFVPCEGTICTNPDHGAGTNPDENGGDDGGS